MKIKLTFSYDGSKFYGFQRQKELVSVQGTIEDALEKIYGEKIEIKGAGRTDAGVHANNQVASFDAKEKIKDLKDKLNDLVLPYIRIKKIEYVDNDFHARFSAKKKEYIYKINIGPYQAALNDYYMQPRYKLDLSLMRDAAKYMIGMHNFKNFVSKNEEDNTAVIYDIIINKSFNIIEIRFIGTHFYKYMVRNLVGSLLEVGKCKISYRVIEDMINDTGSIKELPTAPACGLYLNKIWY